jgi:PEP-CTERM motif
MLAEIETNWRQITMLRIGFMNAAILVAVLLSAGTVSASTLVYTFTGVASGTITTGKNSPISFTNAAFSVVFTEDTSNITGGGGFFSYSPAPGGVFTEGSYSNTFTNAVIETNGNPSSGMGAFETANLFNTAIDNGVTLNSDPVLLGYALNTTIDSGLVTNSADLAPTMNSVGDGFTTSSGDVVEFTGLTALEFAATVPPPPTSAVPEPSTLALFTAGLSGIGMLRRRFKA